MKRHSVIAHAAQNTYLKKLSLVIPCFGLDLLGIPFSTSPLTATNSKRLTFYRKDVPNLSMHVVRIHNAPDSAV